MNTVLSFCFKGERNYVHGTDIVAKLFSHFPQNNITDVDMKFNDITSTNLLLVDGNEAENAKVNIRVKLDGEEKLMQLVESGEPINCRYEYDEYQIINKTKIDLKLKQICLTESTEYNACENFVAMNKHLLQKLYPDEKGKWYFTRLEQKIMIKNDALITVKLIKNFNFRLTKSDIILNGKVIGSVYFTMVKDKI